LAAPDESIADPRLMRRAGRDLLSLALIDSRNHTLRWLAAFEQAQRHAALPGPPPELDPPLWLAGHVAWFQEYWTSRNLRRARGASADGSATRLASILPEADQWFDATSVAQPARWTLELLDAPTLRQYLMDTLEATLELLAQSDETDDALYFFRVALHHEDRQAENFAVLAQALDLDAQAQRGLLPLAVTPSVREPIGFPATRWLLGSEPGGFVPDVEKWAHEVSVPEFEIDAQPVTWGQFVEFVADGGYDDDRLWSAGGWDWVQQTARRSPRYVEQLHAGVLVRREGRLARVPLAQAVCHASWYEADAWCRWAGRRLPAEVEWEAAAHQGATRGFRWGDVWEWTASTLKSYPGYTPDPWQALSPPRFCVDRAMRGGSRATVARRKYAKARGHAAPGRDDLFAGFRSCAL
jgi:ergothioneine biosynthesis protein EgtB